MTVTKRRLARLLVVVAGLSLVYLAHGGLIYFLAFAALAGTLAHPPRGERSRWSYRFQDTPGPVTNAGRRTAATATPCGPNSNPTAPRATPPTAPLETGQWISRADVLAATYTANTTRSARSAAPDVAVNSDKLLSCA